MVELQNVLYVQTQGVILHLDHDTVRVEVDGETRLRVPLMRLAGIVVFGQVTITPYLIHRCADEGPALVWMTTYGRFKAQLCGPVNGNVLLRRAHNLALSNEGQTLQIARQFVAGKLQNSRIQLLRSARDSVSGDRTAALQNAAERLASSIQRLPECQDVDVLRGVEGDAAAIYFGVFPRMILGQRNLFTFHTRTRRPPEDAMNALLSFLYTLLTGECVAAAEVVGLDPQMGFLHSLRPGRPALALDLVEELRAAFADRLALTLANRNQLQQKHFENLPGGAVYLSEEGRRVVLTAYQQRKALQVEHRLLKRRIPFGLVPHVQARLLARHLRGDLEYYIPFVYR